LYPQIPGAILESRKAKLPPKLPKEKNFQPNLAVQMEITKGLNVPLASETLELPSLDDISDRARGIAYDYQLSHGVGLNVPELVLAGLEVRRWILSLTTASPEKSRLSNYYSSPF
jgi:hypothetical protein